MSRRIARWALILVVVGLGLTSARRALADAAPPEPPHSGNVETRDYPTQVQMASENVTMTIGDDQAFVEATFQMKNQGTQTESMDVRFPLTDELTLYDKQAVIRGFTAYVDGAVAPLSYANEGYSCDEQGTTQWAKWHVIFPPGQTVSIGVIYQAPPQPYFSTSFVTYRYILETGAGWYGPIGEGVISAKLPYDVNPYNTTIQQDFVPQPAYYVISGTEISWKFVDLEPTDKDNIEVRVMRPNLWRALDSAETGIQQTPDSLDAHIALARALAAAVDSDRIHGGVYGFGKDTEIYTRAVAEYEYVLQRMPDVPEFNNEFVHLLDANPWELSKLCPAFRKAMALPGHDPKFDEWTHLQSQCARAGSTAESSAVAPMPSQTSASGASDTPAPPRATPLPQTTLTSPSAEPPTTNDTPSTTGIVTGILAVILAGIGAWLTLRAKSGAH